MCAVETTKRGENYLVNTNTQTDCASDNSYTLLEYLKGIVKSKYKLWKGYLYVK